MPKLFTCPRCAYSCDNKYGFKKHFERKTICQAKLADIPISEIVGSEDKYCVTTASKSGTKPNTSTTKPLVLPQTDVQNPTTVTVINHVPKAKATPKTPKTTAKTTNKKENVETGEKTAEKINEQDESKDKLDYAIKQYTLYKKLVDMFNFLDMFNFNEPVVFDEKLTNFLLNNAKIYPDYLQAFNTAFILRANLEKEYSDVNNPNNPNMIILNHTLETLNKKNLLGNGGTITINNLGITPNQPSQQFSEKTHS